MIRTIFAALLLVLTNVNFAAAEEYPNRPVRFVVGAAAGSATDILARMFAAEYQKRLKQNFVVEAKAGAGGDIGAEEVVRSNPDGYTLLFGSASIMFGNQWLYPRTFDQNKDLVSVLDVTGTPMVLVTGPELKGKSLKEVIAMAKAAPEPWALGVGTTFEAIGYGLFVEATGVPFQLARYKSKQQAFVELIKGDIKLVFSAVPSAKPMIESGQLYPLAVSGAKRTMALPGVPNMRELGVNMEISGWNGISGPRGMPQNAVAVINRVGNEILRDPEMQKKLVEISADVNGGTPEDMDKVVKVGSETWGRMIKKFGLK